MPPIPLIATREPIDFVEELLLLHVLLLRGARGAG
jgi:hypothetical protein